MELRHLRYFVAVAEERHFGRAAERVGIGQPPLSQQIQALERELGTQLIRRIPRNIELTDAGEVLLREARLILAQTEHAIACVGRASRGELGKLRIGLTPAASFNSFVTEAMDAFHKLYPDILIALTESDSAALFHALAEGDIDVAFTPPPVSDDRIALDELFEEALMGYCWEMQFVEQVGPSCKPGANCDRGWSRSFYRGWTYAAGESSD